MRTIRGFRYLQDSRPQTCSCTQQLHTRMHTKTSGVSSTTIFTSWTDNYKINASTTTKGSSTLLPSPHPLARSDLASHENENEERFISKILRDLSRYRVRPFNGYNNVELRFKSVAFHRYGNNFEEKKELLTRKREKKLNY